MDTFQVWTQKHIVLINEDEKFLGEGKDII